MGMPIPTTNPTPSAYAVIDALVEALKLAVLELAARRYTDETLSPRAIEMGEAALALARMERRGRGPVQSDLSLAGLDER